ncbi:MAG: hypothetical protein HC903_26810 [Methylacidiphilales bacterium]|nr:hypothetical protein [Candidatus Methylacidiphilales bacterium]NJR15268.1 hypothetical protein [Calothrix sp. CSU_2_0]
MMYYGYRCYNEDDKPLGWLYTPTATEITWTDKNFDWCKKWKTQKGAEKYLNNYNSRWHFQSRGGYLKIEVMPLDELKPITSRKQEILGEWGDNIVDNKIKEDKKLPIISFTPTLEMMQWLNKERWDSESDEDLIKRKLHKFMKMEREGY